jgi:NADH dehydrogenase
VTVVEEDPRLLPQGNERLAAVAERVLRRNGVAFSLGTPVQRIAPDHLNLGAAGLVACDLVLWAVRKRGSPIVARPGWALAPDGRARVDPYLRALGHERVYVVGDAAAAYNYERDAPVQSSAQLAVQEGALAGRNLAADLLGGRREEFRARVLGEALSLGGRNGAAELAGLVLTGRAALAIKEAALIRYLTRLGGPGLAGQYA